MDRIKINSHCCQRIESNIFASFNILLQFNKDLILLLYWVKIFTPPMHLFAFISLPLSKPDPHSEQSLCSPARGRLSSPFGVTTSQNTTTMSGDTTTTMEPCIIECHNFNEKYNHNTPPLVDTTCSHHWAPCTKNYNQHLYMGC